MNDTFTDKLSIKTVKILQEINIVSPKQLHGVSETELAKVAGIGPKTITNIKDELEAQKLSLSSKDYHSFTTTFPIFGNLNCDNAPKRRIIRDYLILLFLGEMDALTDAVSDQVQINRIGSSGEISLKELREALVMGNGREITSLHITEILTHGKEGAAHGLLTFQGAPAIHFAEFYTFESHKKDARIKSITNYTVNG